MDQNVLAKYSLELMENGKFRVSVDWDGLGNGQLHTFLMAIVDMPDALHNKVRKLISDIAVKNSQKSLTDTFLKKNDGYRAKTRSTTFKSNEIAQYHFLHSRHQFVGDDDE